jgi:hypothetical protein
MKKSKSLNVILFLFLFVSNAISLFNQFYLLNVIGTIICAVAVILNSIIKEDD